MLIKDEKNCHFEIFQFFLLCKTILKLFEAKCHPNFLAVCSSSALSELRYHLDVWDRVFSS